MNYSSRRNFLAGLGGAGAAAIMASRGLRGQTAPNARAIDCHHHFVSPGWIKALTAKENHKVAGYTTWFALPQLRTYTPAKDLKDMDRDGVARFDYLSPTKAGSAAIREDSARQCALGNPAVCN